MFWKYNLITASHIETLLDKENVTLKELMDEDDILQECKAQTKKLIDFIVRPGIMDEMITLITQEPDEELDEKHRYKYCNIACELLTFDIITINDALAGDETLLNKLYSFLDTEKPLNPLLASFFSKTMGLLMSRKTDVLEYLKSKDDFITLILNHIETSAIMDLLLRLVTSIDDNEMRTNIVKWLSEQNIVYRLVALIDPSCSEDCNSNAAHALCDIVKVSREHMSMLQEKAEPDLLLEAIESTKVVSELLNHMFSGEKKESVIVNGVLVLLALLEFKKHGPAGAQQLLSNQSQPCIQPENAPHSFASFFFRNDGPEQMTPLDAERLATGVNNVLAAVTPQLVDFHNLLLEPPVKAPMILTIGRLDPPLGYSRLEVAHLLMALISTNTHSVNIQLAALGTIPVLMDLFFKYTWNNFLHTQVEQSIGRILNNPPTVDEEGNKVHPLLNQLLTEYKILQRILDCFEENEQEQNRPGMHRRGYMGHLTKIANHIAQNSENGVNSTLIQEKRRELPEELWQKWEAFVTGTLAEINKKNITPLVGGIPLPSTSEDEESVDFRDIPFSQEAALQQAFSDYQMQQMTSNFVDQFGFNDDEFADGDENLTGQLNRLAHVNFHLCAEDNLRSVELFEQVCREKIQCVEDADSDEDVWEDKEQDTSFCFRERKSSEENSSDSDEDTHVPATSSVPIVSAIEEMKMDIDRMEGWTANFESVPMEVAPAAVPNPWEAPEPPSSTTDEQENWADFSNFGSFGSSSVECSDDISSTITIAMETSETPPNMKLVSSSEISSTSDSSPSTSHVPVKNTPLGLSTSNDESKCERIPPVSGDASSSKEAKSETKLISLNENDVQEFSKQKDMSALFGEETCTSSTVQNGPV